MMGLIVKTMVRAECDSCGKKAAVAWQTMEEAKRAAEDAECFVFSEWLLDGKCPRQTCFCPDCIKELASIESRKR